MTLLAGKMIEGAEMKSLSQHDVEFSAENSSTLRFSAAQCARCGKWNPARHMYWDNENVCSDCKDKDDGD